MTQIPLKARLLVAVSCLFAAVTGCAGQPEVRCDDSVNLAYSAASDSLGLNEFLQLGPDEQQSRRRAAQQELSRASGSDRADYRIRALTNAAGLAPDNPNVWLRLATAWRWLGDYLRTDTSLENAAVAARQMNVTSNDPAVATAQDAAVLEVFLQRAWLHYDRAEWREARPWIRAASLAQPGNAAVLQIRGLLEAIEGKQGMSYEIADDLKRKDPFNTDIGWIKGNLDVSQGRTREAFSRYMGLHPNDKRAAECYRDMGRLAERLKEWSYARRWYEESAASFPFRNITCLTEVRRPRISDLSGRNELPVWLAFNRYYITGSLSAYLNYAWGQFKNAQTPAEKDLWSGLVVNAAGICVRLEMEKDHARRIRGLVFADNGSERRALVDLQAALTGFGSEHRWAPELAAEIGHLFLKQENHRAAIGYLEQALAKAPEQARTWSDLGLAMIMEGERDQASVAFSEALDRDDSLVIAWYNRGLMHFHAGDLEAAESDLRRAAELAPEQLEIGKLLQQIHLKKRQIETQ